MIKTPVQFLNERCAKQGIPQPIYEFEQKQILPTTVFQATCYLKMRGNVYIALGMGQKKKDAQHNAAKAMFTEKLKIAYEDQIGFDAMVQPPPITNEDVTKITADLKQMNQGEGFLDDDDYPAASVGNPIADLDEYCQRHRLPHPYYDMKQKLEGPPHCPVISVPCSVGNLTVSGRSKTKKLAKRIAAVKAYQELRNRYAATGSFGGDVPMDTSSLNTAQEELLQHLSILDNTDAEGNSVGSRVKTYEDFLNGINAFNLNTELHDSHRNHPGPHFQEMLTFAEDIEDKYPLVAHPHGFYEDWLKAHEKGVIGFFEELKQELQFHETWNTIKNEGRDQKFMVVLIVKIPGIEFEPTLIKVGRDVNSLKEKAVTDFMTYLGTMTVSKNIFKKPA